MERRSGDSTERQTGAPAVEPGQVWCAFNATSRTAWVKIVCLYPFSEPDEEPLWVVEWLNSIHKLERMSERTLRALFHLSEEA